MNPKQMVIIAGPNGAGKSTVAEFLRSAGTIANFSNADVIASGMSAERGSADEITVAKRF